MFGLPLDLPDDIPRHFQITTDRSRDFCADVIVFHLPDLREIPYEYKPSHQLWVAWCMESDVNYPFLNDEEIMSYFDIKMTYRLDSQVPLTYLRDRYLASFRTPPKIKTKGINAFISNPLDQSGRLEYFKELRKHLEIDSYGKVLNNCKLVGDDYSHEAKESLIADYKFTIAFENSISEDYVTEKFFQPLAAGSIPVYLGAPNINDFAPGNNCFINVKDFCCAESLANYIKGLYEDDKSYDKYFEWKNESFTPSFTKLLKQQSIHPFIRLCQVLNKIFI